MKPKSNRVVAVGRIALLVQPVTRFVLLVAGVLLVFIPASTFAQDYVPLTREYSNRLDKALNARSISIHSSVKPYSVSELKAALPYDSLAGISTYLTYLTVNARDSKRDIPAIKFAARPLMSLEPGYESSDSASGSLFRSGVGVGIRAQVADVFALDFNYLTANGSYPDFLADYAASKHIIPGEGYAYGTKAGYHNRFVNGYASYNAGKYFNLAVGHGKNFWGDGYRSLLLSDLSNNYSYGRITTTIWRFKYVNLYAKMKDLGLRGDYGKIPRYDDFSSKYATAHYLSFNATKWLTIDLFEAIVWQGQDTLNSRGFDPAYLNPVIFFRPVEFSRGSPDNALMGMGLKIRPHDKWQFYAQLVLDEFLLGEIKAGKGWWANKQGGQLGMKWFDAFGLNGLKAQGEVNIVRPFTYSHAPTTQNWGQYNQPLAHPLGANFVESIGILNYQKPRWSVEAKITLAQFGTDSSTTFSVGSDIYRPYLEFNDAYGHRIGQGVENTLNTNELRFNYRLLANGNFQLQVSVLNRNQRALGSTYSGNYITVAVRSSLTELYRDF